MNEKLLLQVRVALVYECVCLCALWLHTTWERFSRSNMLCQWLIVNQNAKLKGKNNEEKYAKMKNEQWRIKTKWWWKGKKITTRTHARTHALTHKRTRTHTREQMHTRTHTPAAARSQPRCQWMRWAGQRLRNGTSPRYPTGRCMR